MTQRSAFSPGGFIFDGDFPIAVNGTPSAQPNFSDSTTLIWTYDSASMKVTANLTGAGGVSVNTGTTDPPAGLVSNPTGSLYFNTTVQTLWETRVVGGINQWVNIGLFGLTTPGLSTVGAIYSHVAVPSNFLTSINTDGTVSGAQPAASDLSNGVTGSGAVVLAAAPTINAKNLNAVRYADQFAGADCGAKINAAFTDLGGTPGEVWVNQNAGLTISTAISVPANSVLRFIQGGTYLVSAVITLSGNAASIIGQPQSSSSGGAWGPVLLKEANTTNLAAVVKCTGGENVIRDITIDGNKSNNASGGYGVWIYHALRCQLESVSVQNAKTHGIFVESSSIAANESAAPYLYKVMSLNHGGSALRIQSTGDAFISDCEFENSNIGADMVDSSTPRFNHCDFGGNTTYGLSNTSTYASNGAGGFYVAGASQFGGNIQHDIYINGWSGAAIANSGRLNSIVGCNFVSAGAPKVNNSYDAIFIQDSGLNIIVGNSIDNPNGAVGYKNGIEIVQVSGTEGVDIVVGNAINGWATSALVGLANTYVLGNPNVNSVITSGSLTVNSTISATGYQVSSGAAVSGHVLRGNGTNFVDNTLAATDLSDYAQGTWNPAATNLTQTGGSASLSGTYTKIGRLVYWTLKIVPVTNTSSTPNSTYFTGLPYAPADNDACYAVDDTVVSLGNGLVTTQPRIWTPSWVADIYPIRVSGSFNI